MRRGRRGRAGRPSRRGTSVLAAAAAWGLVDAARAETCAPGEVALFAAADGEVIERILADLGFAAAARPVSDLATADLSPYGTLVVVLGDEIPARDDWEALAAARGAGARVLIAGGTDDPLAAEDLGELLLGNDPALAAVTVLDSPQWTVVDPDHPLVQGIAASGDFVEPEAGTTALWVDDPAAEVVAVASDGRPLLAWKAEGGGLVYAGLHPEPAHLTAEEDLRLWRQLLWNALHQWPGCCTVDRGGGALLIQDYDPWGYGAWHELLAAEGIAYDVAGSAELAGLDLSAWPLVVVASDQGSTLAAELNARTPDLEAYVEGGGVLVIGFGSQSGDTPITPPFGGTNTRDAEYYNDVTDPDHPLVAGLSSTLIGYYASHNCITDLPEDARVVVTQTYSPNGPTLYTLQRGMGWLIGTGLVWEYGWGTGQDAGEVLANAVPYAAGLAGCACRPAEEVCDGADNDCDGEVDEDGDGDGVSVCGGDCDDADPAVVPDKAETCDGADNDCNGVVDDDGDADGDGVSPCLGDCDDLEPSRYPGAAESCDGVDQDCDGLADEDFDLDGDGATTCAGDCDDGDGTTFAGAPERCDGIDNDCDGAVADYEHDGDGDGFLECADCDDQEPEVHPGAADEACDGVDRDCGGDVHLERDDDGDGLRECDGDCDDGRDEVWPGAAEICDGLDNDCDAGTDEAVDGDGDGLSICAGDCDDAQAGVFAGAAESCDGVDQDCDGRVDEGVDQDLDGYEGCDREDCDDHNPYVHPGAPEVAYDGVDQDCDGSDATDLDADGYPGGPAGEDCEDADPAIHPAATEVCDDGADNDCDRLADRSDPDCFSDADSGREPATCSGCQFGGGPASAAPAGLAAALVLIGLGAWRRRLP